MWIRLLLAAMLAAGAASAQRGGGGGGDTGGMGGGMGADPSAMGGMRTARQTKSEIVIDKLHLNKEQKEEAAKIFTAAQEAMGPLNEQMGMGRGAITTAILEGKTGEDLNKLMGQYADLMAERAKEESKAYAKLYAILDAKQQAKAAPVFAEQMEGMFDGGGRGGRSNRGGQR